MTAPSPYRFTVSVEHDPGGTWWAVADRPDNVWEWPDTETRQRVCRLLERFAVLESADARRLA